MKTLQIGDKVKFQRFDNSPCRDASVSWIAGDVKFLLVATLAGGQLVRLDVEVAKERKDGIFRRSGVFDLPKMDEDVLCALRKMAEILNSL